MESQVTLEPVPLADRGWWIAVEYGVLTKQERFEKKLDKLRQLGSVKELLEPGGRILYRNLFREGQLRDAWTLLCELQPWKNHVRVYLKGEEVPFKTASDVLWCAGFLKGERPCRGIVPAKKGDERKQGAWTIGCDLRVSVAPFDWEHRDAEKRHVLTFARVNEQGRLAFDRDAIAAFLAPSTLAKMCPLSPARDPAKLAAIFQDLSVRVLGWPVVLEMGAELKKKLGTQILEAEHGFVLKKGQKELEEYEPIELRWMEGAVDVRRARDLRGGSIARQVRAPKKVVKALEAGHRLRGVRIEEGYVKLEDGTGRFEVEQRFVLATRFHAGLDDDLSLYHGYTVTTVPKATPEYERWATALLDEVP